MKTVIKHDIFAVRIGDNCCPKTETHDIDEVGGIGRAGEGGEFDHGRINLFGPEDAGIGNRDRRVLSESAGPKSLRDRESDRSSAPDRKENAAATPTSVRHDHSRRGCDSPQDCASPPDGTAPASIAVRCAAESERPVAAFRGKDQWRIRSPTIYGHIPMHAIFPMKVAPNIAHRRVASIATVDAG